MNFLFAILILLSSLLVGCGAIEPVSLPVPFSGALTSGANFLSENGLPQGASTLTGQQLELAQFIEDSTGFDTLMGHPSAVRFPLFDAIGNLCGSVFFDVNTLSGFERANGVTGFKIRTTLDTCHGSVTADVQLTAFPAPELIPTIDPVLDCRGEPDSMAIVVNGIATGKIIAGDGDFINAVGGILDYSFIHQPVLHSDGVITLCRNDHCIWHVQQ
jgi:hypothetical protein